MTAAAPLPGWYPEANNPSMVRWWDGSGWTQHTRDNPQSAGGNAGSPPEPQAPASRIGSGPLYSVPELVAVEQAPSGNAVSFQLLGADARLLGSVHQVDAAGRVGVVMPDSAEQDVKYYHLYDAAGTPLLRVVQPFKRGGDIFKPKFTVADIRGAQIGEIRSETSGMGRNRVAFAINGQPAGGFAATSWLSSKYNVVDAGKHQIAEIVKREFAEMPLPHIPAERDSYLLRRPQQLPEPLGSLVLLAPVALDIAFHDDST